MEKIVKYSPPGRDGNLLEDLLFGNFITNSSVVVKKQCFDPVGGFDEKLRQAEDWEMWTRLSRFFSFAYVDEVLVRYHLHKSGRIREAGMNAPHYLARIYDVHTDLFKKHRKARSHFLMRQGYALVRNGSLRAGRRFFLKSMIVDPLRLEPVVAMVRSITSMVDHGKVVNQR